MSPTERSPPSSSRNTWRLVGSPNASNARSAVRAAGSISVSYYLRNVSARRSEPAVERSEAMTEIVMEAAMNVSEAQIGIVYTELTSILTPTKTSTTASPQPQVDDHAEGEPER